VSLERIKVRPATAADAAAMAAIYNHYIVATVVTFEEEPIAADEIERRMVAVAAAELPWLVAVDGGVVIGYAYASSWRGRRGYRFSCEVTVYLGPDHGGRGAGSALYRALLQLLRGQGVHLVIGGIALPNDASVRLHEKLGFRKVAHFGEVGCKFGRWIDVGFWELRLNSASPPGAGAGG
jgi:L-amino acid N-acyltransferase YncA